MTSISTESAQDLRWRAEELFNANETATPEMHSSEETQELLKIMFCKQVEAEIQDALEYAENIVKTVREPLVMLDFDLKILTANHSFYDTFKVPPEETIGNFIYDLVTGNGIFPSCGCSGREYSPRIP
jgi:PAS domain-containing protein